MEDLMGRKIAMQGDSSFALWRGRRRRDGPLDSPRSGGERPLPWPPIWVLLLSLGLWALIWAAVSLYSAYALQ
jgi:hypothetical protein